MDSLTKRLVDLGLAQPPKFVVGGLQYETITGSSAYGVATDSSDLDVYGFCIPPKEVMFPHLKGEVPGFGTQTQRFDVWQQHHMLDAIADDGAGCEYDLSVYSIARYFQLCMDNNPNMIDSLFTPDDCVVFSTEIGRHVRAHRSLFLHRGAFQKFSGYAYSQISKMKSKQPEGKRKELVERFGFDVKFAYHVVRLVEEARQILAEGDMDLRRNADILKSIRAGEWTLEDIERHFAEAEPELRRLYEISPLPYRPDEAAIKELLLNCLEMHYGSLTDCVVRSTRR